MSARERILARLRAAAPQEAPPAPELAAWHAAQTPPDDSYERRCALLRRGLEASHAEVHDTTAAAWPALLQEIAAARQVRRLLIGAQPALRQKLASSRHGALELLSFERAIEAWRDALFDEVDAALTTARCGIADTGCLILWPDAAEPRTMSLVPPVHFVLLDAACIHADLYGAMQAEQWAGNLPTNALLISGPSKTADIQQTLAYGAHGPRELIVFLLHAEGGAA